MKLKVPFVKNQKQTKGKGWCGPIALASLLRYYKDKSTVNEIAKVSGTRNGTSPRALAYFCLTRDFNVDYVSKYDEVKLRREYSSRYKKFLKEMNEAKNDARYRKKCEKLSKYKFIKKNPALKLIEKYIDQKKPVLLYLNIAIVMGIDKLSPHYVLVVGYDKKNVYVHNIFPKNKAYQKIDKKLFLKSWSEINKTLIVAY